MGILAAMGKVRRDSFCIGRLGYETVLCYSNFRMGREGKSLLLTELKPVPLKCGLPDYLAAVKGQLNTISPANSNNR